MKYHKYRKFLYISILTITTHYLVFANNNMDIISNNQTITNITTTSSLAQGAKKCLRYIFNGFEVGVMIASITSLLNCILGNGKNKD